MTFVDSQPVEALSERPTTLRPVLEVIPDHCYERSTARGLGLLLRDFVLYGLTIAGLLMTNTWWLVIPLWIAAGLIVTGLFILGHDAAHGALFDSKRLNAIVARLAMIPSWHVTESWVFGHNRVHHGHTLRQGMDFVWHPTTIEEWEEMGKLKRARHRLEWGPFGAGAYYFREVWLNKMVIFKSPPRLARKIRIDKTIVAIPVFGSLLLLVAINGLGDGLWTWFKVAVVPFLLFCQGIGWIVYMHHIDPETRWWPRREWNKFRGQVEGTTVLLGPPGWEFVFHWIMIHLPHHVDMRIPCYRLPEAARAISTAFPEYVIERRFRVSDYFHSTRHCKLHDFQTGIWHRYP